MRLLICTALIAFYAATLPTQAEPPADQRPTPEATGATGELPLPLTHYKGREIATTMHYLGAGWLTRESRQREEDCSTMLAALEIKPGQVVCDLGCGNGFYTLKLAELVGPTGRVLAVDIQQEMLHLLDERAKKAGLENVEPILGSPVDAGLPKAAVDLLLLVDVYHEFAYPEEMLASIRTALKPSGRLALVEFRLEDPKVPIKLVHKMSKEQILKEIPPAGFRLASQFDRLPWQHLMFFVRDDAPREAGGTPAARSVGLPQGDPDSAILTPCTPETHQNRFKTP